MKTILRICLVTREKKDRTQLIRVVKTPQGVVMIDNKGNIPGRGAYISRDEKVINMAKKKNLLNRALRTSVTEEIYDELLKQI